MTDRFPMLSVQGSRYEIGVQVGEALHSTIPRVIDQIIKHEIPRNIIRSKDRLPSLQGLSRDEILVKTHEFLPLFEHYCPAMLEELRGIADGAQISFEEALLLQIRGEVLYAMPGGCSSFALSREATRDDEIIIGQNWDYTVDLDLLVILHLTPDAGPSQLMMTFAGLTSYMGINSAGIGQFANALPWGKAQVGIPHYPFKWRVFQQADLTGIRHVAENTNTVLPGNYVLCDASGEIADLELTPEGCVWLEDKEGFFVHTNHFLGEPFASRPDVPTPVEDSVPRYERFYSLVKEHYGKLDVPLLQKILSDHENYPVSVCRHEDVPGIRTSASLIAQPERGLLHVCAGNPCQGEYTTYSF